ncbi:hypothetical protein HYR99_29510 [Candidatus Poribacteria bacterium]|nr:hypothetical protein [Candidatus Poribacteria bacterium]
MHIYDIRWDDAVGRWRKVGRFARPPMISVRSGSGTNLIRESAVNGRSITINSGHGFHQPHHEFYGAGLTMDQVEGGILRDISAHLRGGGTFPLAGTGHQEKTIMVDGHSITYRVIQLLS